ncbi:Hypp784 [Branchiostoma lanceolatum]|uniref:Hypp784 protein n=1 Tax=Branchiostoma lanceolatum TaxID=7740 RepID=A0A8J9W1N8_BRALA|nr:Hypp784 [Branchiostoma lanceolatum]
MVARRTLLLPEDKGGLGLVSVPHKAKALFLKVVRKALVKPQFPASRFALYWIGLALRRIDAESWSNLAPHSLDSPPHYTEVKRMLISLRDVDIEWKSNSVAALYSILLEAESIVPRCESGDRSVDWSFVWKAIHNPLLTKWETSWHAAHNSLKTRQKLLSWRGFVDSSSCPRDLYYKILSKTIANRLKAVIGQVVQVDQSCGIPGRSITDSLCLLRDIAAYVNDKNLPCVFLALDQEKAFDRVDHDFMINILERLGFGPAFRKNVATLYSYVSSKVIVNGNLTQSFAVERGVRQGCPLSPLLYVLCIEPLAAAIRADPQIKGVHLPGGSGRDTKIVQYADDNTVVLTDDLSIDRTFSLISKFESGTGSKLNMGKTEALWLGGWKGRPNQPYPIKCWNSVSLKLLQTPIGNVPLAEEAWLQRFAKFKAKLDQWSGRKLTLLGKALEVDSATSDASLNVDPPNKVGFPPPKSLETPLPTSEDDKKTEENPPSEKVTPDQKAATPPPDYQELKGFGDFSGSGGNKLQSQVATPANSLNLYMNKSGEDISPFPLAIAEVTKEDRDRTKRSQVFDFCRARDVDVACLQECHVSSLADRSAWSRQWTMMLMSLLSSPHIRSNKRRSREAKLIQSGLERVVDVLRSRLNCGDRSPTTLAEYARAKEKVNKLVQDRLAGQRLRSRIKHFQEGEKPTHFFFKSEREKGRRKLIPEINDKDGETVSSTEEVAEVFKEFYSSLFKKDQLYRRDGDFFLDKLDRTLPEELSACLERPVSE